MNPQTPAGEEIARLKRALKRARDQLIYGFPAQAQMTCFHAMRAAGMDTNLGPYTSTLAHDIQDIPGRGEPVTEETIELCVCGGVAELVEDRKYGVYSVDCKRCGAKGPLSGDDPDLAIALYNDRMRGLHLLRNVTTADVVGGSGTHVRLQITYEKWQEIQEWGEIQKWDDRL